MSIPEIQNQNTETSAIAAGKSLTIGSGPAYKSTNIKIFLAVLLQVLILTSFAAKRAYTLDTGTIVTLQAHTYDPFDVFRGDYVNLRYDISSLPKYVVYDYCRHQTYYTLLKQNSPFWQVVGIYERKPQAHDGEIILKGKVENDAMIHYGIEQFYVPEGKGLELQEAKALRVEIAVDKDGCAMVKSVVPE